MHRSLLTSYSHPNSVLTKRSPAVWCIPLAKACLLAEQPGWRPLDNRLKFGVEEEPFYVTLVSVTVSKPIIIKIPDQLEGWLFFRDQNALQDASQQSQGSLHDNNHLGFLHAKNYLGSLHANNLSAVFEWHTSSRVLACRLTRHTITHGSNIASASTT